MREETLKFVWKRMAADQTYHYTVHDIERYLNGNMTAQEMHDMERAALTDPLLADAIDGYRSAKPVITAKHLDEIEALINNDKKAKATVVAMPAKNKNWRRWAVAAAAMGVLSFSAWLMMKQNEGDQSSAIAKNENGIVGDTLQKEIAAQDHLSSVAADTTAHPVRTFKTPDTIMPMKDVPHAAAPIARNPEKINEIETTPINQAIEVKPAGAETPMLAENAPLARQRAEGFSGAQQTELLKKSPLNQRSNSFPIARSQGFRVPSFSGKVTDENGKPLPGAYVFSGNVSTMTNQNGDFNFSVPGVKDSMAINISALGYEKEIAMLTAGKDVGISLQPVQARMDEIVVVGYGSQKKKAAVGSIRNLKIDTLSTTVYPYPEGGWESFYDDLIAELGVNKSKADKLLHLKFMIENGVPSNFTIIKTPDMAIADRAIAAIKKGPRWKNFKNRAYAEVKMKVE